MKIACSSESFSAAFETTRRTQLEWLDVCANELEVDGVILASDHFPRTDADYLAQLKKTAVDLGLTIVALSCSAAFWSTDESAFDVASALGAPMIMAPAAVASDDAEAWGAFTAAVSWKARAAKTQNIPLAIRNASGTLCATTADLRRLSKDVDSSWLRYALDVSAHYDSEATSILPKAIVTIAKLEDATAVGRLARFRGFTMLESEIAGPGPTFYHEALERFRANRMQALAP